MKIGILTFHSAHNFGAVLQCFALQETLKMMDYDVEVIDYRPEYITKIYGKFYIKRVIDRNFVRMMKKILFEIVVFRRRTKFFDSFRFFIENELNLSERREISDCYDAYIVGSDQLWNVRLTGGTDENYFGFFPFPKNNKTYLTYAVSMGGLPDEPSDEYLRRALENFDDISVREDYLADYLRTLTTKDIHTVLDPTLLADPEIWNKFTKKNLIKQKYVVIYQVRKYSKEALAIAKNIADQIGGIVISLNLHFRSPNGYFCASPGEFLSCIKNASCVVTTSFHGTAFSLIFERPFYNVALGNAGDLRAKALLESVGLEDRFVQQNDRPKFSEIDFSGANEKLKMLRKKSQEFLLKSL